MYSSTVLFRVFASILSVYSLSVVVRMVAAARQRLHGYWVLIIGCSGAIRFGFGLMGRRLAVTTAYACRRGPRLESISARYLLFLIFVCNRFARNFWPISSGVSLRILLTVWYSVLVKSGRNNKGSSPVLDALGSHNNLSSP